MTFPSTLVPAILSLSSEKRERVQPRRRRCSTTLLCGQPRRRRGGRQEPRNRPRSTRRRAPPSLVQCDGQCHSPCVPESGHHHSWDETRFLKVGETAGAVARNDICADSCQHDQECHSNGQDSICSGFVVAIRSSEPEINQHECRNYTKKC